MCKYTWAHSVFIKAYPKPRFLLLQEQQMRSGGSWLSARAWIPVYSRPTTIGHTPLVNLGLGVQSLQQELTLDPHMGTSQKSGYLEYSPNTIILVLGTPQRGYP